MSVAITDPATGQTVNVFVSFSGPFIDCIIRANDRATWEAAAQAQNVLVQRDGALAPNDGITLDAMGPVVLVPAVIDPATLLVTTAAVLDTRYHINMRLDPRAGNIAAAWQQLALQWTLHGTPDTDVNKAEVVKEIYGVGLIDPATIASPSRVWF